MSPETKDILLAHDIKPSFQRLLIFDRLNHPCQHLTVDQIYKELAPQIPTLSKTTVYNTLRLMCDKGIVREIATDHNESRYEVASEPHGHFKCTACGDIIDFPLAPPNIQIPELMGCTIRESHTTLYGICAKCQGLQQA